MQAVLTAILGLLAQIAPSATTTVIAKIVDALTALIPVVISTYKALLPIVQNVIQVLKGNGEVTPEQLAELDRMEAQIDAEFDAAADAALAEDATAAGKAPS